MSERVLTARYMRNSTSKPIGQGKFNRLQWRIRWRSVKVKVRVHGCGYGMDIGLAKGGDDAIDEGSLG
jgi:hypothetical protein